MDVSAAVGSWVYTLEVCWDSLLTSSHRVQHLQLLSEGVNHKTHSQERNLITATCEVERTAGTTVTVTSQNVYSLRLYLACAFRL